MTVRPAILAFGRSASAESAQGTHRSGHFATAVASFDAEPTPSTLTAVTQ